MEVFKYTKLAAESGKDGLIALGIMAIIAAFIIYKISARPDGLFSKTNGVMIVCLAVFAVIAVNNVMTRFQSNGSWQITIDQNQLEWLGPVGVDNSFTLKLSDIKSFQVISTDSNNYINHVIVLNNGDEMDLSDDSGLDFDKFAAALDIRGVLTEKIDAQPTQ